MLLVALACIAILRCIPTSFVAGDVVLDGNGYLGIIVAFESDIAVDSRLATVHAVQDLLTRTSQTLNKAVGKYIKGAVLLFPASWDLTRMFPDKTVGNPTASSADILVTAHGTAFGTGPHALQHSGCGSKGSHITLPVDNFLMDSDATKDKAKLLAVEWMKYRYGVFSEGGFPDDPTYPLYYSVPGNDGSDVKVTDCANVPVTYVSKNEGGENCDLEIDSRTGLPQNSTRCNVLFPDGSTEATSSLLSPHHSLSSVQYVCGDENHKHNAQSPNKQNVLCRSKSVLEVMKQHEDFQHITNFDEAVNSVEPPTFHYVQEKPPRIVLAMDSSSKLQDILDILHNAAADLVYSLPSGAEFGCVVFGQSAEVKATPSKLYNLKDKLYTVQEMRITRFDDSANACVKCGLRKAIELLAPNSLPSYGTVVLLTSSNFLTDDESAELFRVLQTSQLCLTLIIFPTATADSFREILGKANSACSRIITVPKADATIQTMRQTYQALNTAINTGRSLDGQRNVTLKMVELNAEKPVTFTVDQSFKDFIIWVSNTAGDISKIEGLIDITSDGLFQKEKLTTSQNFYAVRIRNIQSIKWTCSLRPSKDFSSVLLKIVATENEKNPLSFNAWAEEDSTVNEQQKPFKLYASLFQDNNPIINAEVTAEIQLPDGRERISLKLLDNGLGDPDVTHNDGIYSTYFVQLLSPGEYEVKMLINDNNEMARILKPSKGNYVCCGSKGPRGQELTFGSFSREITFSFHAANVAPSSGYPPSAITDLRGSVMRRFEFMLTWTAPGGEKNIGQALKYFLKVFETHEKAIQDETEGITDSTFSQDVPVPAQYGTSQSMLVKINSQKFNVSYYFVIRTINKKGRYSTSNVVEVFTSLLMDNTTPNSLSTPVNIAGKNGPLGKTVIIIIVICSIASLLIIIICAIFCVYVKRKEQKRKKEGKDGETEVKKPINKRLNNRNDGSVVASDWHLEQEQISPLSSVPATLLMHNHEQVQEAKRNNRDPPLFTLENFQQPTPPPVPPKPKLEGVIALASSPKLQRNKSPSNNTFEVPNSTNNANVTTVDEDNVQPKSYLDFKRQITSV